MAIIIGSYRTRTAIDWQWPLKLGAFRGIPRSMFRGHFTSQFSRLIILDKTVENVNVLLFDDGLAKARQQLSRHKQKLKANIVLIFDTQESRFPRKNILDAVEEIRIRVSAAAVFVIDKRGINLSFWLDNLFFELSHNKNIIDALPSQTKNAVLYYSPRIERETKLDYAVERMIVGLEEMPIIRGRKISFNTRISSGKLYTPKELARFLRKGLPNFKFEKEGGEATDIIIIRQGLDQYNLGSWLADRSYFKSISMPAASISDNILNIEHLEKEEEGDEHEELDKAKLETEVGKEPETQPRFLQAKIYDSSGAVIENYALPRVVHTISVRIGLTEKDWLQPVESIKVDKIFEENKSEVENIDIVFRYLIPGVDLMQVPIAHVQQERITLPRYGNSTQANFTLVVEQPGVFEGEIEAYYSNRLLQRISLRIPVREKDGSSANDEISVKLIYCQKTILDNLSASTAYNASYTFREDPVNGASLSGMHNSKPIRLFFSDPLDDIMHEIKSMLQKSIMDMDKHPDDLFHQNNIDLIWKLAIKGNKLFVQHLKKRKLEGPLQIVTNRPGFAPLDFVYENEVPADDAKLCDKAVEALKSGKCQNCFDKSAIPATHICPLGFWGFKQVIERSAIEQEDIGADYLVKSEIGNERRSLQVLNKTLFATSARVNNVDDTLRASIGEAIGKYSTTSTKEVDTWEKWQESVKTYNPDSMVLVVHVENHERANEDQIEIGDKQFLLQNRFGTINIKNPKELPSPIMIVIGCEVNKISIQEFDISAKLMQEGAAIVLTNFTRISGRRAADLVIRLIEFLKQEKNKEISLGETLLKLRRSLFSNGNLTGLSVVAYGDADWKLKT